jgi:hydroxyquinol 1,2-dioxygenase
MIVSAPGYESVTTHLFVADSPYLHSDAVFGMKDSLVVRFERCPPGRTPTGERVDVPYYTAQFDFRLRRAA